MLNNNGPAAVSNAKKLEEKKEEFNIIPDGKLSIFAGAAILICRIMGIGYQRFPTHFIDINLWIAFLVLVIANFVIGLISTDYVLRLKVAYPKLK